MLWYRFFYGNFIDSYIVVHVYFNNDYLCIHVVVVSIFRLHLFLYLDYGCIFND